MPTLDRALPLAEVDDPAMTIPDQLELDMPGSDQEFLDIDRGIAEGSARLGLRGLALAREALGILGYTHPLPPPTSGRLDQDGETDLPCNLECRLRTAGP